MNAKIKLLLYVIIVVSINVYLQIRYVILTKDSRKNHPK